MEALQTAQRDALFGAKRTLTKGCLRLLNYEYTH
jgi:hypothetical protein